MTTLFNMIVLKCFHLSVLKNTNSNILEYDWASGINCKKSNNNLVVIKW